ncbi:neutrophil gelatinase-associated lipocalin-like [Octodon degus]|uniref:Neutrophil gelatinase-associated lipocalin-like n=1 Tax=Octodon degus TaxID=10160 RepID=A0A6P3VDN3_OCTDE|nr:neutrophil gelatinase-associated lipocalin-like [Octodon degus]
MALGLLFLTLLCALKIHAQNTSQSHPLEPLKNEIPLQANFQDALGKWYGIGLADNWVWYQRVKKINMFNTLYELQDDHSFNVTYIKHSGNGCDYWNRTLIPSTTPGQYNLGDMPDNFQLLKYTMKVVSTNYEEFAIVHTEKDFTTVVKFTITLYGRTNNLSPAVKNNFYNFAKSQGVPHKNIIFTQPTDLTKPPVQKQEGYLTSPVVMPSMSAQKPTREEPPKEKELEISM